jgi:hypothetical protein
LSPGYVPPLGQYQSLMFIGVLSGRRHI